MTIADRDEVRKLAGNRLSTSVPDVDIDQEILAADAIVKLYTQKEDWDATHMEWHALKQASELIASSYIRQRFKEESEESERQYKEGLSLLELINRRSTLAGERQVVIKRKAYKSFPLNPSGGLYYSSIHKKSIPISGGSAEGVAELGAGWFF